MTSRVLRYFSMLFLLGVAAICMGCGGSSSLDKTLADGNADATKASSAINGDITFVSPTPANNSSFTGVFTFNAAVSCSGVSGGTWYCVQYKLYKADDTPYYYMNNTNTWSFPQTIPLPHDYFNWVTFEATFYGYNSTDGLVVLDVEQRDYFVNTKYY